MNTSSTLRRWLLLVLLTLASFSVQAENMIMIRVTMSFDNAMILVKLDALAHSTVVCLTICALCILRVHPRRTNLPLQSLRHKEPHCAKRREIQATTLIVLPPHLCKVRRAARETERVDGLFCLRKRQSGPTTAPLSKLFSYSSQLLSRNPRHTFLHDSQISALAGARRRWRGLLQPADASSVLVAKPTQHL